MLCLVATTTALIIVDTDRLSGWTLNAADGVFYGVATDGEQLFAVARQAPYGQDLAGRQSQNNVIVRYSTDLRRSELPRPDRALKDAHQCAYFDGRLWVMNTADNAVSIWRNGRWTEWRPFGDTRSEENPDTHHLNSLAADDRHIALIANKGGTGTVYLFDRYLLTPAGDIDIGGGAHTVWKEIGVWQVMASKDGEVRDGTSAPRMIAPYLRGYACDGTLRACGISETNAREDRASSTARLAIYDMDWGHQGTIEIPGVGMVHDLHVLNIKDLARPGPALFHIDDAALSGLPERHLTQTDTPPLLL